MEEQHFREVGFESGAWMELAKDLLRVLLQLCLSVGFSL
jgi:hypothetical protein